MEGGLAARAVAALRAGPLGGRAPGDPPGCVAAAVDRGAGELVRHLGGVRGLSELGVRWLVGLGAEAGRLRAVGRAGGGGRPVTRVLVLLTRPLDASHGAVVGLLRGWAGLRECAVFCSVSEEAHAVLPSSPLSVEAYAEYREILLQDLQKASGPGPPELAITVQQLPVQFCPLGSRVFVFPSHSGLAGSRYAREGADGPRLPSDNPAEYALDDEAPLPEGVSLLAHALFNMGLALDLLFNAFSVGPAARAVARALSNLQAPAGIGLRGGSKRAGLILVDRTLDMVAPALHGDNLVDRIVHALLRPGDPVGGLPARGLVSLPRTTGA